MFANAPDIGFCKPPCNPPTCHKPQRIMCPPGQEGCCWGCIDQHILPGETLSPRAKQAAHQLRASQLPAADGNAPRGSKGRQPIAHLE